MPKIQVLERKWLAQFSKRLVALMESQGINQLELAEKSGLSQATISNYIAGERSPKLYHAIKLAKALGVFVEELV